MSGCAEGDWTIILRLDKNGEEETFTFDLNIVPRSCRDVFGITVCDLEGRVFDAQGRELSHVRGRCRSTQSSAPAMMDLDFHLRSPRVGIFMGGLVVGTRNFTGVFRAYDADRITPPPNHEVQEPRTLAAVDPDTGDTGTGTGSATLVGKRKVERRLRRARP